MNKLVLEVLRIRHVEYCHKVAGMESKRNEKHGTSWGNSLAGSKQQKKHHPCIISTY